MEYSHVRGLICGLVVLWIGFQKGTCIRCFTCDVTSSASYADANDECNGAGMRGCADAEESACMLEGFLRETNTVRVIKRCMKGCPLYINTTAEVVRCCTEDGCNAKFEPIPARRPTLRQPPRGYNERERGGYNVPMQGTNRPYNPNNIEVNRLEGGGPLGGRYAPDDTNDLDLEDTPPAKRPTDTIIPAKSKLPAMAEEGVVNGNTNHLNNIPQSKEGKPHHPREKGGGLKKYGEKKMNHDRNTLAEQKLKKNESAKMAGSGGTTVVQLPSCGMIVFTAMNVFLVSLYHL